MNIEFKLAEQADLPSLISMLADDDIGQTREDLSNPPNGAYVSAFEDIVQDKNNELVVVKVDKQIAGMLQLTYIPCIARKGAKRCLVEGVRIHADFRDYGLGTKLFNWVIARAKQEKCSILQLTSDKLRSDAIRFYHKLGFEDSHVGMKMTL